MFIRTVHKRNKSSKKLYTCQQLVESIRTDKGVRQKLILSLGVLNLPKEQWARLAKRIESIIHNQQTLFEEPAQIEQLARKFAQQIIQKHALVLDDDSKSFETVDVQSFQNHRVRRVGAERLGVEFFKKLDLHDCLQACGLSKRQIEVVDLSELLIPCIHDMDLNFASDESTLAFFDHSVGIIHPYYLDVLHRFNKLMNMLSSTASDVENLRLPLLSESFNLIP